MIDVLVLVVAVAVVCLAFTVVVISYIYRRRRSQRCTQEKYKPTYDTVTKPRKSSLAELLGTAMGPDVSPVTPTEFFTSGNALLRAFLLWLHLSN